MDVYVHFGRIDFDGQEEDGLARVFDEPAVGFADGMGDEPIADVAAVEEYVLPLARRSAVRRQAREAGLSCPFLVGGAVVTKAYADSIGAHYAKDGVDAVRVVQSLVE